MGSPMTANWGYSRVHINSMQGNMQLLKDRLSLLRKQCVLLNMSQNLQQFPEMPWHKYQVNVSPLSKVRLCSRFRQILNYWLNRAASYQCVQGLDQSKMARIEVPSGWTYIGLLYFIFINFVILSSQPTFLFIDLFFSFVATDKWDATTKLLSVTT